MTITDIVNAAKGDSRFAKWLSFELVWECEYVQNFGPYKERTIRSENVVGDGGGETFAGIDKSSHPLFPFGDPVPSFVVEAYRKDWNDAQAPFLGFPIGETIANFTVNRGRSTAGKLLQLALNQLPYINKLDVDGQIGPRTIHAVELVTDKVKLALLIVALADVQYRELAGRASRYRQFLSGWLARDKDLAQFDNEPQTDAVPV